MTAGETAGDATYRDDGTEKKLFSKAVTGAIETAEISEVVDDYVSAEDVRDTLQSRRQEIWAAVAVTRDAYRDAKQVLRQAEDAVRRTVLDQEDEEAWVTRHRELEARLEAAQDYANSKRLARERVAFDRSMLRASELDALVSDAESTIDARSAALGLSGASARGAQPDSAAEGKPAGANRGKQQGRQDPALEERLSREYRAASESLTKARRAFQDLVMAEERRRLILEPVMTAAIRRDADCDAARQALKAAEDSLSVELLQNGTLPMARAFVNQYVATLHRTSMRVPAESGLYDTFGQSLPVMTQAIEKVADWLGRMKGASIGVAGPRGAGKTTLIEYFCSPLADPAGTAGPAGRFVRLRVSAPVNYVPLEFIIYLLGELCRMILRLDAPGEPVHADSRPPAELESRQARRRWLDSAAARQWLPFLFRVTPLLAAPVLAGIAQSRAPGLTHGAAGVIAASMLLLAGYFLRIGTLAAGRPDPWPGDDSWRSGAVPRRRSRVAALFRFRLTVSLARRVRARRVRAPSALAALSGAAALAAIWRAPERLSLLFGACVALGVAATLFYIRQAAAIRAALPGMAETPMVALAALAQVLAAGGLAAAGLAWYPRSLNYLFALAIGLVAVACVRVAVACVSAARMLIGSVTPRRWHERAVMRRYRAERQLAEDSQRIAGSAADRTADAEKDEGRHVLARQAAQVLGLTEYAQTLSMDGSRTWTAGLGGQFPVSFEKATTAGATWARQPWSVPAAVDQFRELLRLAAKQHAGVIVGIDELDKLEYDKSATFLNDIKAIFGVPGSYFLVSVSENAAAGFERRGVPFRDVFDSSFDEIITVGYLDWRGARELLNTRVVGMHAPFAVLCYLFSGGLARDLIRTARAVLGCADGNGEVPLAEAVRRLCRDEMLGKTHGICRELANLTDDDYAMSLLAHVQTSDESFEDAVDYLDWSEYVGGWIKNARENWPDIAVKGGKAIRFARELAVFGYFTATVAEFFGDLDRSSFERATRAPDMRGDAAQARIERLAKARQSMAVSPVVAERYIIEFRADFPGWRVPRPVSGNG